MPERGGGTQASLVTDMSDQQLDRSSSGDSLPHVSSRLGAGLLHTIVGGAVPFLAVICVFAFYGQEHRS